MVVPPQLCTRLTPWALHCRLLQLVQFKAQLYRAGNSATVAADSAAMAAEEVPPRSKSPTLPCGLPDDVVTRLPPQPSTRDLLPLRLTQRPPVALPNNVDHLHSITIRTWVSAARVCAPA